MTLSNAKPRPQRRSLRLPNYDYTDAGGYFITICTKGRRSLLGRISDGQMHLNDNGRMLESVWNGLPERFPDLILDAHIVMPNHFHGILIVHWHGLSAPKDSLPTLGDMVGALKSLTSRQYVMGQPQRVGSLWQDNYYEHIVRNDAELDRIRKYIAENPLKWEFDRENPAAVQADEPEPWEV